MIQAEDAVGTAMPGREPSFFNRFSYHWILCNCRTQISSASSPALSPTISHQMQRFLASSDQAFPVTYPKDGRTSSQSCPRGSTGNRTKEVPHFPAPSAPLHILPKNSSSHGDSGTPVKQSTPGKIIQRTPRRKSPERLRLSPQFRPMWFHELLQEKVNLFLPKKSNRKRLKPHLR